MTTSTARFAYSDVYELMDKALADPKGIRTPFETWEVASHYRLRLNSARGIDRRQNAQTFEVGHPMYGQSVYDKLTAKIKNIQGQWYLYLEQLPQVQLDKAENLSEIQDGGESNGTTRPRPEPEEWDIDRRPTTVDRRL